MNNMKNALKGFLLIGLMALALTTSCASNKTLEVWKDEGYNQGLRKVLVIGAARVDFMQNHLEGSLCESLASRGVEALRSHKIFSQAGDKLDRQAIAAKVRELGIKNVLVVRLVSSYDVSRTIEGGYEAVWQDFYNEPYAFAPVPGMSYDAEFFTIATKVYDVESEKLIWSSVTKVKVENSKEGAIDPFVSALMKQLEGSKLF
jgi:hypothetical protein